MKRSAKRTSRSLSAGQLPWRAIAVLSILILFSLCALLVSYQYHKNPKNYPAILASITKMTNWVSERKNHLHKNIVKVKQLATSKNPEDVPIHFEFYSALPKMQMIAPVDKTETVMNPALNRPLKKPLIKSVVADASELEEDLSSQLKSDQTKRKTHNTRS